MPSNLATGTIRQSTDVITVNNVAELSLMGTSGIPKPLDGQRIRTLGYYTPGDGGANEYFYNAGSAAAIDGGFYVVAGPNGVGVIEAVDKIVAHSLQWGCRGDSTSLLGTNGTDDTARIQAMADSEAKRVVFDGNTTASSGGRLYLITDTVTFAQPRQSIDMRHAGLTYGGPADRTALRIGDATQVSETSDYQNLSVFGATDWTDPQFIGIELINLFNCDISFGFNRGFHTGVRCVGDSQGWAYNSVTHGYLSDCKIGLSLERANVAAGGFNNENSFKRLRYGCSVNLTEETIAFRLTGPGVNGNTFSECSSESSRQDTTVNAITVELDSATDNRFENIRIENQNSSPLDFRFSETRDNRISLLNSNDRDIVGSVEYPTGTTNRGNVIRNADENFSEGQHWESGLLAPKSNEYDGAGNVYVQGMHWHPVGSIFQLRARQAQVADGITIPTGEGLAVFVEANGAGRFSIKADCSDGEGRYAVIPYDATGAKLPSSTILMSSAFVGGAFGGDVWQSSASLTSAATVDILDNSVYRVEVIYASFAGSDPTLQKLSIYSHDNKNQLKVYSRFPQQDNARFATSPPASAVYSYENDGVAGYSQGTVLWNANAAAGGTVGWVNVGAGNPGTWRSFGSITP